MSPSTPAAVPGTDLRKSLARCAWCSSRDVSRIGRHGPVLLRCGRCGRLTSLSDDFMHAPWRRGAGSAEPLDGR